MLACMVLAVGADLSACGSDRTPAGDALKGAIVMDGSSTVAPLMTLAGGDFHNANGGVSVTVA